MRPYLMLLIFTTMAGLSYGQPLSTNGYEGQHIFDYEDACNTYSFNPPAIMHVHPIKREQVYVYFVKRNKVRDSALYQLIFYDTLGRVSEVNYLNKDGKSAEKIVELTYDDRRSLKIQARTSTAIDGFDLYFNANGTLDYTYAYRLPVFEHADTMFTTVVTSTYDTSHHFIFDSIRTTGKPIQFLAKYYYDKIGREDFEVYGENESMRSYSYVDTTLQKTSFFVKTGNVTKWLKREKYFNADHQTVKVYEYPWPDLPGLGNLLTTYTYNPDKTVAEIEIATRKDDTLFRHFYFTD